MGFTFKTQYDPRLRRFSRPGEMEKITFAGRYDENGRVVLEEKGRVNTYEEIQSHAESCDINLMVKRFLGGDQTALTRVQGFYGDVTQMPTNLAESMNQIMRAEEAFNSLPVDVRAKFDHSLSQFLASAGSKEFFDALGVKQPGPAADVSPTVKPKEVVTE